MSNLIAEPVTPVAQQGPVEVRTDARVVGGVGAVAAAVAIAYLTRVVSGGSVLDWAVLVVTAAIAVAHLQSLVDARVPLLVVDEHGVRLRRGRTWQGLPWAEIEYVEHAPRHGLVRDGRVLLVPRDPDAPAPAVALTVSTRVTGAEGDLTAALRRLAGDPDQVVEPTADELDDWDEPEAELDTETATEPEVDTEPAPHHPVLHDPRPSIARAIGFLADRLRRPAAAAAEFDQESEPTVPVAPAASATPLPLRETVAGVRSEVRFEGAAALRIDPADAEGEVTAALPELEELRRDPDDPENTVLVGVIDDLAPEPAPDPVIGPEIVAARTRLALTVDQLADRTRIRPHVIESIEVDDFAPCGGDFYARGHLRTLARVLGVDAAPLLAAYDERYADAPIDARRIFETELATADGGPIRSARGGPNWSILVAAVMAVVLAWSIVRLITDSPVELHSTPVLNGSPSSAGKLGPAVPVLLDASSGGAHVVVRDGSGQVVFNGDLAFGDSRTVKATPPVRIQSSDGGLKVTVDGQERGPLGADGQPAQNTFAAAE